MKSITWSTPYRFSPAEHEQELSAIIREIETVEELDRSTLDRILRKYPKGGKGFFSKSEIIQGYRHLRGEWKSPDPFIERVRMKPVRTLSGVAPVTVLTQPYPCPGECIFCPNDVRMPKSYLSREPGAQRAAHHQFDPYRQTFSRLRALRQMGHGIDKVELIILGGTWSSYPESYQLWFLRRCFEAMNDFGNGEGGLAGDSVPPRIDFRKLASQGNGRFTTNPYNQVVADFLKSEGWDRWAEDRQSATWEELARAQRENEHGTVRNVGLSVETRPDHLSEEEVGMIRRQGATKVQIGYQSLSDDVLRLNRRGHDVAATRRAMRLLRHAGFKIQAHWMPNLYGSSPQEDIEDFDRIFSEPDFRPDELKIYPCSLIESAELMSHYEAGAWRPYSRPELLEVLIECMRRVPPYCRVTRVIRDIPGDDILVGNKTTNLRAVAERELRSRGWPCRDIRSREIRSGTVAVERLELGEVRYETPIGEEVFLQFVTEDDRIVGFLRLALPERESYLEEIGRSAVVREVHVYGATASLGEKDELKSQHLGLGRKLIRRAETLARQAGYLDLAVISSVGTREYYRRQGFADGTLYQHRRLEAGGHGCFSASAMKRAP